MLARLVKQVLKKAMVLEHNLKNIVLQHTVEIPQLRCSNQNT
jgi:hypothetical protein